MIYLYPGNGEDGGDARASSGNQEHGRNVRLKKRNVNVCSPEIVQQPHGVVKDILGYFGQKAALSGAIVQINDLSAK
jgi:hypothetical protein